VANQRPRRISDFKPTLTKLAQTSHYAVNFGSMSGGLSRYLERKGVDRRFITGDLGLLCNAASLPFASLATTNVTGGYTGITEKFAHSRMYVPITLTFYVDREYKVLKFLEHWMEFIAGGTHAPSGRRGAVTQNRTNYFIRMQYPDEYRMEQTQIIKFERDYNSSLQYTFFNLFPQNVTNVQVAYDQSKILTASATFEYTRYVTGPIGRLSTYRNWDNNTDTVADLKDDILKQNNKPGGIYNVIGESIPFFDVNYTKPIQEDNTTNTNNDKKGGFNMIETFFKAFRDSPGGL
tara:strand:+ start:399 stop:1274 length:876 start_codon:yes stop_codon:yes gene_type:complete